MAKEKNLAKSTELAKADVQNPTSLDNIQDAQEQNESFDFSFIELVQNSLKQPARKTLVNLSFKYWDVSKIKSFERVALLMVKDTEVFDEKTDEVKVMPAAYFMDEKGNVFYKAAYQFVKALQKVKPGTNFSATFEGLEKNANNNNSETFTVNVFILEQ